MIQKWNFRQLFSIFLWTFYLTASISICDLTSKNSDDCTSLATKNLTCSLNGTKLPQNADKKLSRIAEINLFQSLNASAVCGKRLFPQARIIGGNDSTFGKWPWQISLQKNRSSTFKHDCGAVLLNENWALTAAHCVKGESAKDLLLRLGQFELNKRKTPYAFQKRKVLTIIMHPQVDWNTMECDLALLRFHKPLWQFQLNISPICLPEDDKHYIGNMAFVTGWGRLNENGKFPAILQELSMPILNNTVCEKMYMDAGFQEPLPHEMFVCAGYKEGGRDTCTGDSGGPLVLQRKSDKRWILIGISSWGRDCAKKNQPGLYTRISTFRDWINHVMSTN